MRSTRSRKLSLESLERRALLTTFFVDGAAAGGGDGSAEAPFVTIQEGVDAAAGHEGADTVKVHAGTYQEHLQINDTDGLRIEGLPAATIESPDSEDNVISILAGDVTLQKLTIQNGRNGIEATGNSLRLHDVNVQFSEGILIPDPDDPGDTIAVGGHGVIATEMESVEVLGGNYSHNGDFEDMHGILVERVEDVRLTNVTATENGQHGVDANRIGTLTVVGGTYVHNLDGDGIHVDRTDTLVILGGVYSDNDGDGIDLRRTDDARISGVTVERNGNEGIEVDDTGTLRVVGSTVVGNAEDGLDIDDTAFIYLIGVRSMNNGFDDPDDPGSGLQVEAEDDLDTELLLVVGSVFSGNAADGIQISEPDDDKRVLRVDLRAVTVSDNAESGLDIDISGTFNASAVTSTNNGEDDSIITG